MRVSTGPKHKACHGKVYYRTAIQAKNAARRANRRNEETWRGRIRPYRCAHCGDFHIGHST